MLATDVLDRFASAAPEPAATAAEAESRTRLWRLAAEVLTEQQMTVVWLFYVEQLPVKEVGRIVGGSRVAVRGLLFRARQRLLEAIPPGERGERVVEVQHG
jgi:RNA polymerase sigma factor (sigma-70 family)